MKGRRKNLRIQPGFEPSGISGDRKQVHYKSWLYRSSFLHFTIKLLSYHLLNILCVCTCRMCGVEAELLSVLGHMPGEEEDLERKLTQFEREKNQSMRRKEAELKKAEFQLSQQRYQKEEKE